MPDPVSLAIPAAGAAFANRDDIAKGAAKLSGLLLGKRANIVVTGLAGSGKSVVADRLAGKHNEKYTPPVQRSRDVETVKRRWLGARLVLRVIPGQDYAIRRGAVERWVRGKKPADGVVHVVSNGYASVRDNDTAAVGAWQGIDLAQRRRQTLDQELQDLAAVGTAIAAGQHTSRKRRPRWLLVVINKVDLFSDPAGLVEAGTHYQAPDGEFQMTLQRIRQEVGLSNLEIDLLPLSAWQADYSWGSESVKSNLQQAQANAMLINVLDALAGYVKRSP